MEATVTALFLTGLKKTMKYNIFARYYDRLTENIDYRQRAQYFSRVFKRYGKDPQTIIDVACGTGSLGFALLDLGYSVIGVEESPDMLVEAAAKLTGETGGIFFLNQTMQELDIGKAADGAICALDSVNHLEDFSDVLEAFLQVSLSLAPGGIFVFDVNTEYKHEQILADNTFVYELDELFLCWQNEYYPEEKLTDIYLDFFLLNNNGSYTREQEYFSERFYSQKELEFALNQAGFRLLDVFGEDSFNPPAADEQRLIYVAQKFDE